MSNHTLLVLVIFLLPWRSLSESRKTIADMSCHFIRQPLNHFALPRHEVPHYHQRYCIYEFASMRNSSSPVLFYTGNESPLETYVNHTGLMWSLAKSMHATVVFAEHRYEGLSLPSPRLRNCLAYSSSVQAIADYARLIELHFKPRPVIAFGGSYGGMLSAWMRMKYPNLVAGAIAASAPIWGLPLTTNRIDGAFNVIMHGLQQPYPPTIGQESATQPHSVSTQRSHCAYNLLATWPLIQVLGESDQGRHLLTSSFSLCSPLKQDEVVDLTSWLQSPWFDLAEGSFPYPSSYIPFALTHDPNVFLPAWPLQAACWNASSLSQDLGIRLEGNLSDVAFQVQYGASGLTLGVEWDAVTTMTPLQNPEHVARLLTSARDAVGVWFNMTKDISCYNLTKAPNIDRKPTLSMSRLPEEELRFFPPQAIMDHRRLHGDETKLLSNSTAVCEHHMRTGGSWPALYCNEEMNLIIDSARGMGNDMFWPPSHPRGTETYADIVAYNRAHNLTTDETCNDPNGTFGFPKLPTDPWSTWLDIMYGGKRIGSHSNIIFSNGKLDPWSAAGVYAVDPTEEGFLSASVSPIPGVFFQNITDSGVMALIMDLGGHHTDLMYNDVSDPLSIRYAREIEGRYVMEWIKDW